MRAIAVEDIGEWLRGQHPPGRSEVWLYTGAIGAVHDRDAELFLTVFARLVTDFGTPDFPPGGPDWPGALGLPPGWVAVWDFDYYQLSIRADSAANQEGGVVLAVHKPADPGIAPDPMPP